MELIRIILVDDHDLFLDGLAALLKENKHIDIVAKANSAELAEKYIRALNPDLVITDITMSEKSGLELTRYICTNFPDIKVMVLSMHDEYAHISSLIKAGAKAYLLKNVKSDELNKAIDLIMRGETYIQSSIAASFFRGYSRNLSIKGIQLSPRELEIVKLIAQGNTSIAIAGLLNLSVLTIETHRKNILRKTGCKSVVGLLAYARENDLI